VYNIDLGRKGLATDGKEHNGRISFSGGLLSALAVFKEVHDNVNEDLETLIMIEHVFVTEELRYSEVPKVESSMTAALASFEDALLSLGAVQDVAGYKVADKTWPHLSKYRYHDMPKDAFHIACASHYTRINNTLRTPGINSIERQVYEQRLKNMSVAQSAYLSRQQSALAV
jgi:predicted nucleic acid-binding protein